MVLKKHEFTSESGNVDTYEMCTDKLIECARILFPFPTHRSQQPVHLVMVKRDGFQFV